ncbi:DUF7373 family lipoprotein [Nocardia flavorosea]|uniref:Uncharacterized protein n=1 Tax=Nocardia flavorosea TaxID=53429 RepID=A0A846YCR6_9NOCA|nr:hypothetical protein [Nocardia flavorosea]NKY56853.1 hypothetical protein [Nocardia flavorosea]
MVEGEAVRVKPDLSGLNVGNYPTEPIEYGTAGDEETARYRESQRLGDYVAIPFEADPAFAQRETMGGGPVVMDRRDMDSLVISDTFDEVAADLIAGWVHTWETEGVAGEPNTTQDLSIAVLMFPDAPTAETVATGLEHDDFTFTTDNRPVQLPNYPQAKAHWRPGIASLGSWTSYDRYVVFIKYEDFTEKAGLPTMIQKTESLLAVQTPLLDQFEPTRADQLPNIQLDPDGVLALSLPRSDQEIAAFGPSVVFHGRGALSELSGLTSLDFLDEGQVTEIALAETVVMRSKSATGAEALWETLRPESVASTDVEPLASPAGIEDGKVECFTRKTEQYETQSNFCILQTGRYFAQIEGAQVQDLHQKTAAQYALIAGWG